MKPILFGFFIIFCIGNTFSDKCGCKSLSRCYVKMLKTLQERDEVECIEDAAIDVSTVTVFLTALENFCGDKISVYYNHTTEYIRNLYEVVVMDKNHPELREGEPPTIVIDAGQEAGKEPVAFALYIIQQLIACRENKELIENVKWVIMPSTNPDGFEFSSFRSADWRKNLKIDDDGISYGVDISRNFNENWDACKKTESGFDSDYRGSYPGSEKETAFIKNVLDKHKATKIYLSIRKDGHHIGYPYAFSSKTAPNVANLKMVSGEIANKVNMRSSDVTMFKNNSIYNLFGTPWCGHSVDYAQAIGINLAFELRTFLDTDYSIISMSQTLPRGFEGTLRNGYMIAIKELYNVLTNKKKYGHVLQ